MEWQPIETAPKRHFSDHMIDLWIKNGDFGYREVDCWWDEHAKCWVSLEGRMYFAGAMATHWLEINPPT